jgi:hypothetical protein
MRTPFKVAVQRAEARKAEKAKAQTLALKVGPGAIGITVKEQAAAKEEACKAEKAKARARASQFVAGEAVKVLEKAAKEQAAAKEKEERVAASRDLKLPAVQSYALCDEPDEVAECKAFADAMHLRITGKPWRSHVEVAEEKAVLKAAADNAGLGKVGK